MKETEFNQIYKQVYRYGVQSFWYFPTVSFVCFLMGLFGLCYVITSFLFTSIRYLNGQQLLILYEVSILLLAPFLCYLVRRFLIKRRSNRYENQLSQLLIDEQLGHTELKKIIEKVSVQLSKEEDQIKMFTILINLGFIFSMVCLFGLFPYMIKSVGISALLFIFLGLILNYFFDVQLIKVLKNTSTKKIHLLSFVQSEFSYMDTTLLPLGEHKKISIDSIGGSLELTSSTAKSPLERIWDFIGSEPVTDLEESKNTDGSMISEGYLEGVSLPDETTAIYGIDPSEQLFDLFEETETQEKNDPSLEVDTDDSIAVIDNQINVLDELFDIDDSLINEMYMEDLSHLDETTTSDEPISPEQLSEILKNAKLEK
ncbi:hypothetical protein [Enterococcus sp. AZ103]|uniref:hypothetical protein n=1 Tax=Enterococcus sp. AZ103 TaxID=2774628 RepID=UPI003F28295A